jgi:hypothetical protein
MDKFGLIGIAILIFLINIFIFWKLSKGPLIKEYGKAGWKNWRSRLYYWQAAIYYCTGGTFLILFLLKWANILSF